MIFFSHNPLSSVNTQMEFIFVGPFLECLWHAGFGPFAQSSRIRFGKLRTYNHFKEKFRMLFDMLVEFLLISGRWFETSFIFTPKFGEDKIPILTSICFRWVGEKPPTRYSCSICISFRHDENRPQRGSVPFHQLKVGNLNRKTFQKIIDSQFP